MNRRALLICLGLIFGSGSPVGAQPPTVERWGLFELALEGPREGNPFLDVTLSAEFSQGDSKLTVRGFYDGEGRYLIRFSPPAEGV